MREEEEKRNSVTRYQDLCLIFRRRKTGDVLLSTGGKWDNYENKFLRGGTSTAKRAKIIDLEESQVEFSKWYSTWLDAFIADEPRDTRLVLTAGERRGGKTTIGLLSAIALAVGRPNSIVWVVSSTYQERDEIESAILRFVPSNWYIYRGAPKYRFIFSNGSVVRNVSADDPETLKQGRVDLVFVNEAQKMQAGVLTNSLPGIIDCGGLTILAANPPRRAIGEWVRDLKEAIDAKRVNSAKFFGFSAKLNEQIDQQAREDVGSILRVIDPKVAAADDEGLWLPVGDVAYSHFAVNKHVIPPPYIGDTTKDFLRSKMGRPYEYVNGADFQSTPHMAGVSVKIYKSPDGRNIYHVVGEVLRDGTEDDFLDTVDESGIWTPENTLWVGDASGTWQDGAHKSGRVSFDIFKSRRWHILPPQRAKTENRRPKNPAVEDRINLVNKLLAQDRLYIAPQAQNLALSIKKCPVKFGKPYGRHSHITDALGYVLYYLEPAPKPEKSELTTSVWSVANARRGSGYI
jgi:hypothetical protein